MEKVPKHTIYNLYRHDTKNIHPHKFQLLAPKCEDILSNEKATTSMLLFHF